MSRIFGFAVGAIWLVFSFITFQRSMNGWSEGEPAWWLNLQANPVATVQLADGRRTVKGRAAAGEERSRLWSRWRTIDDNLDAYAARRSGETAVVILERAYRPVVSRTERSFDREEVGERLGSALPYVVGIERILVELVEIDPVFTARPSPG